MIERTLEERMREYGPASALEQESILQETMQLYILASLSQTDFFSRAAFQGGTCLRLIHGLERFSEDLDFILHAPSPAFAWGPYLEAIRADCRIEGIEFDIVDRAEAETNVRKTFLKTDSIGKLLELHLPFSRRPDRKLRIRLEIDICPPRGSMSETHYLHFPRVVPLTVQALPSGFAGKCHALLCRPYIKGRDWFDFAWYVARGVVPNYALLDSALEQMGPWAGTGVKTDTAWLTGRLMEKIGTIDWRLAREDVQRFIPTRQQASLDAWSAEYFLYLTDRLRRQSPSG